MDVVQLASQLESTDQAARQQAAEKLSQNAESASVVACALARHAGDDDRIVAEYCVATLEELGPPEHSQLDCLAGLLSTSNPDVLYWAITLLGRAGTAAAGHRDLLAGIAAGHADANLRSRANWAVDRLNS